jgi:hypothetical protein
MPRFKCESCRTSLYSAARAGDLIDDRCPSCGAPSDSARPVAVRARRPAPIRWASADHQRIADRLGAFMDRGRAAQARLDAERWLDDGGSFSPSAGRGRAPTGA